MSCSAPPAGPVKSLSRNKRCYISPSIVETTSEWRMMVNTEALLVAQEFCEERLELWSGLGIRCYNHDYTWHQLHATQLNPMLNLVEAFYT